MEKVKTFDLKSHNEHFGITEDREKPGGSNAGKYDKAEGPFCGPSGGAPKGTYPVNTESRAASAIAYAKNAPNPAGIKACVCKHYPDLPACKENKKMSETKTMPVAALHFMDHECFATTKDTNEKEEMVMVAYSGGVIPKHFFWGNLAIDLNGMKFPKEKYPILENHDTQKKIGFANGIDIDGGALVIKDVEFVDTKESLEFRKLSKSGFPYQSSIYASPSVIEKIPNGEAASINGMMMEGPLTVWRESEFKEASVCVFGYDSNTKAAALASDNIELTLETLMSVRDDQLLDKKEMKEMTFEQFSAEHPELIEQAIASKAKELTDQFAAEKADLENQLAKEKELRSTVENQFNEKLAALEKREALRRENEIRLEAANIWTVKLAESSIPDRLYEKVTAHVSADKFIKDGDLDKELFSAAVDAEIADWVKLGIGENVQGFGLSMKDVDTVAAKNKKLSDDDDIAIQEMLAMVGDPASKK